MRALCIPLVGDAFFQEIPVDWPTVLIGPETHVMTHIEAGPPGPVLYNAYTRNGSWVRKDGSKLFDVYEER